MSTLNLSSSLPRSFRSLLAASALGASLSLVCGLASAEDVPAAANAYAHAQKAEMSGDYEAAADLYEVADNLAPTPEAVRSALRTRKAAGQLGPAAVHAETLLKRYPDDRRSRELAEATLAEAKKKFSRYVIRCQPKACNIVVDGAAATTDAKEEHLIYLIAGEHSVTASFGKQQAEAQQLSAQSGEDISLSFEAPPEPKNAPGSDASGGLPGELGSGAARGAAAADEGLPLPIFLGGAVLTAGLGATTVWSGFDTLKARDHYKDTGTQEAYDTGKDKERRTNILIIVTAGAAVATGVLAILTDWGEKPVRAKQAAEPHVHLSSQWVSRGALMAIDGTF